MESLTPSTFGLPAEIPSGTTVLPYMTHIALAAAFDDDWLDPVAVYKRYLPLLAAAAESFVVSPRVFCAHQVGDDEEARCWSVCPTLEFWRPEELQFVDESFRRLLHDLWNDIDSLRKHNSPSSKWAQRVGFSVAAPQWEILVLSDALGLWTRLTTYDLPYFDWLLRVSTRTVRPPAEPTGAILIKHIEHIRSSLFTEISKDFYFPYYDLRIPAILALALREAQSGNPRSLLTVIQQMREQDKASAFRAWAASVDALTDHPAQREKALTEARHTLDQLSRSLSGSTGDVSLQVGPLPPFVQLTFSAQLFANFRDRYRKRAKHLAFLQSTASRSFDIGRMADDFARVFGIPRSRTSAIQSHLRQAWP